jgi:hypothetical protein
VTYQHNDSWRDSAQGNAGNTGNLGNGVNRNCETAGDGAGARMRDRERWKDQGAPAGRHRETGASAAEGADRWAEEQLFEEDVRAVLTLMRPNRRERLQGWSEYRTGGAHFRATVNWNEEFETADGGRGKTRVPNMADVLEALLVGSAKHDDDLTPAEEFDIYREVVRELYRRLNDLQECYE